MNKFLKSKNNHKNLLPKLSDTIHILGRILGLVIKDQEGSALFKKVEIFFSNCVCIDCVPQINLTELNPKP